MVGGYGPVFKSTGKKLDVLTHNAIEEGYLPKDGTEAQLRDLIRRAVSGEKISPVYAEGVAEQLAEQSFAEHLAQQEEASQDEDYDPFLSLNELGYEIEDASSAGRSDITVALQNEVDALLFQAEDVGIDVDQIKADAATETEKGSQDDYLSATKQKLQTAISSRTTDSNGGSIAQDGSEGRGQTTIATSNRDSSQGDDRQAQSAEQGSEEGLTSYAPEDVKAEEARLEQIAKDKAKAEQATTILDAANITGKERIDVLKDVKQGAITPDELKAAYPAKDGKDSAAFATKKSKSSLPPIAQSVIDALINRISGVRKVASDARITVVTSPSELPVKILEQAKLEGIPEDEIHGVLYKGVAYIVRQNLKTKQDVEEVLLHEVLGHGGINALLGDAKNSVLSEAFARSGGIVGLRKVAMRLGVLKELNTRIPSGILTPRQQIDVVDEMLALAQGKSSKLQQAALEWWNTVRNHIIDALNTMGFTDTASKLDRFDASEAAVFLREMREAVLDGGDISGHGVAFMTKVGTESQAFKRWSNDAPVVQSEQAESYDFKTGEKVVVEAYHGTGRGDRVGTVFQRKRATSGPMAFFTSSPALASSYAIGKADTSRGLEDNPYESWFKFKVPGQRTPVSIDRAWYALTQEQRATVRERMPDIRQDDEGNVIYEKDGGDIGSYEWNLQQTQKGYDRGGNPLKAAVETWLNSGAVYGNEQDFMKVLKLAGFPVQYVEFDHPHETFPFVYKAIIAMNKPLVTNDIPSEVVAALDVAAKKDRSRAQAGGVDTWDKNTRTLKDWVSAFHEKEVNDPTYAWTSIPDKVTEVLKSLGYDGVIDRSGKGGGNEHPVYIPFSETQVKSEWNKGKFDSAKKDIFKSKTAESPKTPISQVRAAISKAYGNLLSQLEKRKLVIVTQTQEEAIEAAAQARSDKTGESVDSIKESLMASVNNSAAMRLWIGSRTVNDFLIPETAEYEGSTTGDLAYVPENNKVPSGPLRVTEGVAPESHRGRGIRHMAENALAQPSRKPDPITGDLAEDLMRQTVSVMRGVSHVHNDGSGFIFVNRSLKKAVVAQWRGNHYTVISVRPFQGDSISLWGNPEWIGRLTFPIHKPLADSSSEQITRANEPNPSRSGQEVNSEHFNLTPKSERSQPTVTIKKRRSIDIKRSADGHVQGFFDPQTGKSFLIADNLSSSQDARGAIAHEIIGRYVLHSFFGGSLAGILNRIHAINPRVRAVPNS
jgi:hypothetical protein